MRAAGLVLVAALGCSAARPERFEAAGSAAERAYSAGRYREAARHWQEAARHAEEARDRHEAQYRAAASYERSGELDSALEAYVRLSRESGERAARAAVAAAGIEQRRGREAQAQKLYIAAVRAHPQAGPAEVALRRHLEHVQRVAGRDGALAALDRLLDELSQTELDERLRYERARLLDESGQSERARDAYLETAARHPYPEGALWDDALFRAALCEERLGRPRQAVALLERMLAEREAAHLSGSYERARYGEARFKIAELYRDALGDPTRARAEFRRVWTEHPTSLLRDDALFEEALLARAGGDTNAACGALRLLVEGARDSRFAPCAPRLCPALAAPDGRPCRDYLLRRLEPDGRER